MDEIKYKLEDIVVKDPIASPRIVQQQQYKVALYSDLGNWKMCHTGYVELNTECPGSSKW